MKALLLLSALLLSGAFSLQKVEQTNPGITVSTSVDGINQVTHLVLPFVFQYLKGIELPDVTFQGGEMTDITFTVLEPESVDDVNFTFVPQNNSVKLHAEKLNCTVTGNFTYDFLRLEITGEAFVNISDMIFDLELNMTTQESTIEGKMAPAVKILNVDIEINPDNIEIKLVGGMVAKIAKLFTEIFKKQIITQIVADSELEIENIINNDLNDDLKKYGV